MLVAASGMANKKYKTLEWSVLKTGHELSRVLMPVPINP
jgi:hypothetical protein